MFLLQQNFVKVTSKRKLMEVEEEIQPQEASAMETTQIEQPLAPKLKKRRKLDREQKIEEVSLADAQADTTKALPIGMHLFNKFIFFHTN